MPEKKKNVNNKFQFWRFDIKTVNFIVVQRHCDICLRIVDCHSSDILGKLNNLRILGFRKNFGDSEWFVPRATQQILRVLHVFQAMNRRSVKRKFIDQLPRSEISKVYLVGVHSGRKNNLALLFHAHGLDLVAFLGSHFPEQNPLLQVISSDDSV